MNRVDLNVCQLTELGVGASQVDASVSPNVRASWLTRRSEGVTFGQYDTGHGKPHAGSVWFTSARGRGAHMDWLVVAFYGVLGASVIATTIWALDRLPIGTSYVRP